MRMIPETSPENYMSGSASLNVPSPDGTGDWHTHGVFSDENRKPLQFFGSNDLIQKLGTVGIIDRSEDARMAGIPHRGRLWASNHVRAIADMVIKSVMAGKSAEYVRMDDFLHTEAQKIQVLKMVTRAKLNDPEKENLRKWLKRQK